MDSCCCPLLRPGIKYSPDTINLTDDAEARQYWINCFVELAKRFVNKVNYLHPGDLTAAGRAEHSQQMYLEVLNSLRDNPGLLLESEPLSIRTLLELNERFLRENGFKDAWLLQKEIETNTALEQFAERLTQIDRLESYRDRWTSLIEGLLAGNMFDWGAQAISDILEKPQTFQLNEALSKIESRPWLVDHLESWLTRIQNTPHECCAIFVDNAGIDFVLGILPMVREFLRQQTDVYLCANTLPSLNDLTVEDLEWTLRLAAKYCPIIKEALASGKLKCFQTGQTGPCLDLRNLHPDLCAVMPHVDLVIFEGMGRALHTNLYVKLSVDCFKLAVIKNEWLANRLGGKKFSVLCQFEPKLEQI